MAKQFAQIDAKLQAFIEQQKVFFVGTAATTGRVNISPKGMDALRVLAPNRVVWLNVTGSGNETAAHIAETNRIDLLHYRFHGKLMGFSSLFLSPADELRSEPRPE